MDQLLEVFRTAFTGCFVDLSLAQVLLILAVSAACGAIVCVAYRLSYRGALFSRSFCMSLFAMTLVTTLLIMAIRSNIMLSLGTLGALSIIRFRTAIKEPMDMAFLFLGISAGIICGANMLGIAVIGVVLVSLILFGINRLPHTSGSYMLIVTASGADEAAILACVTEGTRRAKLKSRSATGGEEPVSEYIWEVSLPAEGDAVVTRLSAIAGVTQVSCVKSNAEYI